MKYGEFLTQQNYLDLIEFASTVNSLNGNAFANQGLYYQKNKKDYKKAQALHHRAATEAIKSDTGTDLGKFIFLEAECMALQGHYSAALKLVKTIPDGRISKEFQGYLNRDLPKWTKAAKE